MRSSFFLRLYATYVVLVLLTSVSIGVFLSQRREHALERDLETRAVLLEPVAERVFLGESDGEGIRELAERAGIRITLIDPRGEVLADSHHDIVDMANHRERPEIRASFEEGVGTSRRFSATLRYDSLFVAQLLGDREAPLGVVRVSVPLAEAEEVAAGVRGDIVDGTLIGALAALVVGAFVARRVTAPVAEMERVTADLRAGRYDSRVSGPGPSEYEGLSASINRLGSELAERVQSIGRDDAQVRAILSGMGEGVVAVGDNDQIVFCNAVARDLLGLTGPDPLGRKFFEAVRNTDLSDVLEQARRDRAAAVLETTVVFDGRPHVVKALANPFRTEVAEGVVLVLQDLTDLRHLEKVRQDFVANVSHELKTPLTSIKGYVETLLGGAIDDEKNNVRFLQKIEDHVERLTFLVTDLLSLARTESPGDRLELVPVDLQAAARDAAQRHERAMARKSLDFVIEGDQAPIVVRGDREALREVLDNLITNANHYTPEGGRVRLVLSTEGTMGCICVEDSGLGIPPEDLDRIFERFYRVDKARSRVLGGTGLGLAIVKHLVAAMRGEVRVESELGSGSRFFVRVPIAS